MDRDETQKPVLCLGDRRSLESIVAFTEQMTGENMTPDEIEEVRRVLDSPPS